LGWFNQCDNLSDFGQCVRPVPVTAPRLVCGKLTRRMRRLVEILVLTAVFGGAFFFSASTAVARPDYSRRTQKECNFCHPRDSWNLNDAGKYYRDHHYSLQGYAPPAPAKPDTKQGKG
jgi:hypothetical protein